MSTLFYSCANQPKTGIEVLKEIEIKASVGSDYPTIYYEKELQQELIYTIDKVVKKKICFFNMDGKLLRSTPLNELTNEIDNVGRVTVVALDTIIINSNYTNEIVLINRFGKIWKKYSLGNRLIDSLGNQYELFSSVYPISQNPNSLVYGVTFRENLKDMLADTALKTDVEELEYFNKKSSESAFFVTIKNWMNGTPAIQFQYYGFYKSISQKNVLFAELPAYFPVKETIMMSSFYSANLFLLNRKNFQPFKTIPVYSSYTSIGTHPLTITKNILGKIQDSITFKQKTSGCIEKILFDTLKAEYYIIVRHNSTVVAYNKNHVPFSIIVLNNDLSKKAEHPFTGSDYNYYYTLLSSEGLLLFKNDTTKRLIKDEKMVYDLVKLHN